MVTNNRASNYIPGQSSHGFVNVSTPVLGEVFSLSFAGISLKENQLKIIFSSFC